MITHLTKASSLLFVICALFSATTCLAQQVPPWEEKVLIDNCADGQNIVDAEHVADKHIAAHDPMDSFNPSIRKAATLSKKCANSTKSLYAKDWYLFSFANDSFRSVTSSSEADTLWPPAIKILKDLSEHSKWKDVRKAASESLQLARQAEQQNGIP